MDARSDRRAWVGCVAAIAAASLLAGASVPASAAGDHGPLTCLDGYVWRQATPQRPRVRHARGPRADGAATTPWRSSRRSTTPGTFGPDLCAPGYVWREAVPGDHVCVTPATWQQVHDDNLTAGARRNALRVKVGRDAATGTYRVHADGINVGVARVAAVPARADAARALVARGRAPQRQGPRRRALVRHAAARVHDAPERDRPRARPVVAALVLVAPDRDGLHGSVAAPDVLGPMARGGRTRARVAWPSCTPSACTPSDRPRTCATRRSTIPAPDPARRASPWPPPACT